MDEMNTGPWTVTQHSLIFEIRDGKQNKDKDNVLTNFNWGENYVGFFCLAYM